MSLTSILLIKSKYFISFWIKSYLDIVIQGLIIDTFLMQVPQVCFSKYFGGISSLSKNFSIIHFGEILSPFESEFFISQREFINELLIHKSHIIDHIVSNEWNLTLDNQIHDSAETKLFIIRIKDFLFKHLFLLVSLIE